MVGPRGDLYHGRGGRAKPALPRRSLLQRELDRARIAVRVEPQPLEGVLVEQQLDLDQGRSPALDQIELEGQLVVLEGDLAQLGLRDHSASVAELAAVSGLGLADDDDDLDLA